MTPAWKWTANSCIPTTPCCSVEWSSLMTGAMPAAVWGRRATACCADLAHVPLGWRATILHVRIRRYRCSGRGQVWRQDTTAAAAPRAKLSTQAVMWFPWPRLFAPPASVLPRGNRHRIITGRSLSNCDNIAT
jgi:hypothetical protein